jgi:hypothetical protein
VVQQVVLSWLPEGESVERQTSFQPGKALDFVTERQHGNAPFYANGALVNPIGYEIGINETLGSIAREHLSYLQGSAGT